MTIVETILHTGRQQPWAYEIPATFVDDTGQHHNLVMMFREGVPDQAKIDAMVAFWIAKLEAEADEEFKIEPEV